MDGNGRWAQHRGLPRLEGHRAGTQNLRNILEAINKYGVRYVTLYAFSTENWSRPNDEVRGLMAILRDAVERETQTLHEKNVRIQYLGRMDRLSPDLRVVICKALELTRYNTGLTLSVAFDYGGRDEIVHAVRQIVREGIPSDKIEEEVLERYLYTRGLPDPDLIVRTAGEQRLSNFLIWQSAYSEYYCSSVLWPDFNEEELGRALHAFSQRKRRFGALAPGE
ncbi:MAG: di-trans,poly-cis-decaprenylcistransferase [Chloroflexi bacterium]|nr:di-trans,poly-cis-decaprenylcistransferase [Chloroflexota bacterium]